MTDENQAGSTQEAPVVTIDGVPTLVAELSQEVQQMIMILNRWRGEQEVANLEKLKVDAAVRDLSNQVVTAVRAHREEALAPANAATEETVVDDASDRGTA